MSATALQRLGLLLLLLFVIRPTAAAISLPSIYGSHMVLQANQQGELWGMAGAGATVSVTVGADGHVPLVTAADAAGRFSVALPSMPASLAPVTITIESGADSLVLSDVLFGSVYVCSGQSNMELTVIATINATAEIAAAGSHGDGLRIMQVAKLGSYFNVSTPQTNLSLSIPWSRSSPGTVKGMSALCYYYGVEQATRYPDVPVGVVASSWGGTDVQVWSSPEALAKCGGPKKMSESDAIANTIADSTDYGASPPLPHSVDAIPSVPSTLWNAMIAPLMPLRLTGFLWYQGESNAANPTAYECQFPAKISQWRSNWPGAGASTPYIFVQIAPWPAHDVGLIAGIRYAQLKALELPSVGMVVAADIGDPAGAYHPIHPPWKQEVARRAAVIAENLVHGNTSVALQGPKPVNVTWSAWDDTWGKFHHGIANGVCSLTTGAAKGYLCGGIQITFDQPITLRNMQSDVYVGGFGGLQTGQGSGGGFELWNNNTPSLGDCDKPGKPSCASIPAMLGPSGDTLTSSLCTNCAAAGCPCKQPMAVTGILDDGRTLQLNVTYINGLPRTLKYAWHDYPTMTVFSTTGDRPAPPFNATIHASPK